MVISLVSVVHVKQIPAFGRREDVAHQVGAMILLHQTIHDGNVFKAEGGTIGLQVVQQRQALGGKIKFEIEPYQKIGGFLIIETKLRGDVEEE